MDLRAKDHTKITHCSWVPIIKHMDQHLAYLRYPGTVFHSDSLQYKTPLNYVYIYLSPCHPPRSILWHPSRNEGFLNMWTYSCIVLCGHFYYAHTISKLSGSRDVLRTSTQNYITHPPTPTGPSIPPCLLSSRFPLTLHLRALALIYYTTSK